MIFLYAIVLIAVLNYLFWKSRPKWKNLPPGPKGYPWIGNLHQMEKFQYKPFGKWAREFGDIFVVTLAGQRQGCGHFGAQTFERSIFNVCVIWQTSDEHTRPYQRRQCPRTEGDHWEQLRRFSLRQLRDFGFGRNSTEESIMQEVNEMLQNLKEWEGKSLSNIKKRFVLAVVNSLWFISTGKRFDQNDESLLKLQEKFNETVSNNLEGKGALVVMTPWLAKVIPEWSGYNKVRKTIDEFKEYFKKPVDEHLSTYSPDYQRDFTDSFIQEINRTTDKSSAFFGQRGVNNLIVSFADLYGAGNDTTSTTLTWMVLYLSKFPEIQRKLQAEIGSVTGNSRSCSVTDRPNMPYTEAVIAETLRFASIAPLGLPHRALADVELKGFMIPKDTMIWGNFRYINHDDRVWGDPEVFRPERFLSGDGKSFTKHEAFTPFSTGRRQCIGETLAKDSLFLFSTNLFQRFEIKFDKDGPDNGFEPLPEFTLTPKPFNIILKERC